MKIESLLLTLNGILLIVFNSIALYYEFDIFFVIALICGVSLIVIEVFKIINGK